MMIIPDCSRRVIALGLIVLGLGCGGETSDKAGQEETLKNAGQDPAPLADSAPPDSPTDISQTKPDFSLTVKQYVGEWKKDSKAAKVKYKDKVVELTGRIRYFGGSSRESTAFIVLVEGDKEVMCGTAEKRPWRKATPGQTAKVKGKPWLRYRGSAILTECVLVSVSGLAAPSVTADELAKEYAADQAATTKKYQDKYLLVSGEIAKVTVNDKGASSVTLKTVSKLPIDCIFNTFHLDASSGLKAGQKIKILGQYELNFAKDRVRLDSCLPLEEGK